MTASPADENAQARQRMSDALKKLAGNSGVTPRTAPGSATEFNTELLGSQVDAAAAKMVQGLRNIGLVEGESQADQLKPIVTPATGQQLKVGTNVTVAAEEFGPSKMVSVKLSTHKPLAEAAAMVEGMAQRIGLLEKATHHR